MGNWNSKASSQINNRNTYLPVLFCFFNDTATTEIYTLSLHDALPIWLQLLCDIRRARLPTGDHAPPKSLPRGLRPLVRLRTGELGNQMEARISFRLPRVEERALPRACTVRQAACQRKNRRWVRRKKEMLSAERHAQFLV